MVTVVVPHVGIDISIILCILWDIFAAASLGKNYSTHNIIELQSVHCCKYVIIYRESYSERHLNTISTIHNRTGVQSYQQGVAGGMFHGM